MNAPRHASAPAELARIRAALGLARPAAFAHALMAPRVVGDDGAVLAGLHRQPDANTREAAVLLALTDQPGQSGGLELLFIRRPTYDGVHSGQIAFPGGRREGDEPLETTALRETHEEIGIAPDRIELLGALSPLFVWVSNHLVQPYVGRVHGPLHLKLCEREVAEVIAVPLARLLAGRYRGAELVNLKHGRAWAPYFALPATRLWGASAMMLAELVNLLDASAPD